jgi:acetyl-CoA C-acetyltransferase
MTHTPHHLPRRVGVVSSAQTAWRPAWSGAQHIDLISAAVHDALEGCGLRIEDVDFVIDSGSDVLDGRSISNCGFLGAMGAHHKEESRVEDDGLWAALYGANKIASRSAEVGLIIAYAKPSEAEVDMFHSTIADPFVQRPVGLNDATANGLIAQQYLARHRRGPEILARVAAQAWARARANPKLELEAVPSVDEIMASESVASPLRRLMMARPVDGAVALVLASETVARRASRKPVWVTGMGAASDGGNFAQREPGFGACSSAARRACERAGVKPNSVNVVEMSATSAAAELATLEALGVAEAGAGADVYLDGGLSQINASGGALPAYPVFATGLVRLAEASDRLVAAEGDGRAIVHASSGLGAQSHCVFVIES